MDQVQRYSVNFSFDAEGTRENRVQEDKLASIQYFFETLLTDYRNGYSLSECVTIDEIVPGYEKISISPVYPNIIEQIW